MTKKEQAAMQAAIDRAETLAALRWTNPIERDVGVPEEGFSVGWDYNLPSNRVWTGWSDQVGHGEGSPPENGKPRIAARGARKMFSSEFLALAALRHEMEKAFAAQLLRIDRRIAVISAQDNPGETKP